MSKKNQPAQAPGWEVDPAPPLPDGYTWCPECRANFLGDVCPGCSPGISVVATPEAPEVGELVDAEFVEEPDPTTLAEVAEQAPPIKTKEIKETLKCILTEAEILEISRRGSRAHAEILQIEEELQAVKSQFKSRTDTAIAIRTDCAQKVNNGYEFRPVDCEMVLNYNDATVLVTRLDTFETVSRRSMSREERKLF